MSRWSRSLYGNLVPNFTSKLEEGDERQHSRRRTDMITDEMVKGVANNGQTTKELVARNYLENKVEHAVIRTTQSWHSKIIIAILVAFVSGFIGLTYYAIRMMMGG